MKNMTIRNIVKASGGTFYGNEALLDETILSVVTDSRKIEKDGLFVAICGERSDGHDYIKNCLESGALCAVSENELDPSIYGDKCYIKVNSSMEAIGKIAAFYRRQLSITVVGITGSVGKTSTKETVASVLSERFKVLKTPGNFNNELGLPLTIFGLNEEDEVAVLEMGINHFGEMHRLSRIARPDISLITNIGTCHLENLRDRDGVLEAKTEIFDFMNEDGTIILNGEDDKLRTVIDENGRQIVYFGDNSDIFADEIESLGLRGTKCRINTPEGNFVVIIPIPGDYMILNALAATAVALALRLEIHEIKAGLEKVSALDGRNKIIPTRHFTVIDSVYNASPASMRASIDLLCMANTKKVAILGDMGELGDDAAKLHFELGEYVAESDVDILLTVGELSAEIENGFNEARYGRYSAHFDTVDELIENIPVELCHGDAVLVKASHFMKFEKVLKAIVEQE